MSEANAAESGSRRKRRWRRVLVQALMVTAIFGFVRFWQLRDLTRGPAPEIVAQTLAGEKVRLSAMRGRPVLVHFWASWCPVCRMEEQGIHAIAADHAVLTVALETATPQEMRRYVLRKGLSFPVIRDAQGAIGAEYGVSGVPASFVVDSAGIIRFAEVGYTTEWGLRARLWLSRILYDNHQAGPEPTRSEKLRCPSAAFHGRQPGCAHRAS